MMAGPSHGVEEPACFGDLPLSFQQEGQLMFEWRAELTGTSYAPLHASFGCCFDGDFDTEILFEAVDRIMERHIVLRTSISQLRSPESEGLDVRTFIRRFLSLSPGPVQIFRQAVCNSSIPRSAVIDLCESSPSDQRIYIGRFMSELLRDNIDYRQPPFFRIGLFRVNKSRHLVGISWPHLVGDGISASIFRSELCALYDQIKRGKAGSLPGLPIQYHHFASDQHVHLRGPALDRLVSFWTRQWESFSLLDVRSLCLNANDPNSIGSSARGRIAIVLSNYLYGMARALGQRFGCTTYIVFLSAFGILLHKYTRMDSFGIWGYFSNRKVPGTEYLVGWLANAHLLGLDLSGDPTIQETLARVRMTVRNASANEELPTSTLISILLQSELPSYSLSARDTNYNKLLAPINVAFEITADYGLPTGRNDDIPSPNGRFGDKKSQGHPQITDQKLKLSIQEGAESTTIAAIYYAESFDQHTIWTLLRDYRALLSQMIEAPADSISRLTCCRKVETI
jgi:hypothetical protein